jgi:Predicted transcriptional regulator
MSTESTFRQARIRLGLAQKEMAKRLGITRSYLSEVENGHRHPSEGLVQKLLLVRESSPAEAHSEVLQKDARVRRRVPVISWARAGAASSYEEMPLDWQEVLPSDCPDEHAFGLILEGDSMEPKYFAGDVVVLMPTRQVHSNQLVGAKIRSQGIVFKMLTVLSGGRRFRLTSYNSAVYPPIEHPAGDFEWIFPAYELRRRLWHQ